MAKNNDKVTLARLETTILFTRDAVNKMEKNIGKKIDMMDEKLNSVVGETVSQKERIKNVEKEFKDGGKVTNLENQVNGMLKQVLAIAGILSTVIATVIAAVMSSIFGGVK